MCKDCLQIKCLCNRMLTFASFDFGNLGDQAGEQRRYILSEGIQLSGKF